MTKEELKKNQSEHFAEASRNMFECSFQAGFDCAVEKAYEWLDHYMTNEVYVGNHSRQYADSFMEKFKQAMEE